MRTFVVLIFGAVLTLAALANWANGTAFDPAMRPIQSAAAPS